MKKNKFMRLASALLVLTLLSTCAISGTFAKYTSTDGSEDTARVAYWGWTPATMDITGLFANAYGTTVVGNSEVNALTDVIAPGTNGSATFAFAYAGEKAPEVAYSFVVDTTGSTIDATIENNPNILWSLDNGAYGNWDTLIANIEKLDGDKDYNPGELPTAFTAADDTHTVSWKWIFDQNATDVETGTSNNDAGDTAMGNVDATSLAQVKLVINITATQLD